MSRHRQIFDFHRANRLQSESRQSESVKKKLEEVRKTAVNKEKNNKDASYGTNAWQSGWQVRSPGSGTMPGGDEIMETDDRSNKQPKR